MKVDFTKNDLENIKYCVEEVLKELDKNQFSTSFQFELVGLSFKLYDYLKESYNE